MPGASAAGAAGAGASAAGGFNPMYLLMGVQALGTAATSYAQSKAQSSEAQYNASILESNARIEALKAADAIARGEKNVVKAQQASRRLIGSQRVAMGAQGIDLESGSALDIQKETAALGAEDVLNIRNNAWREAWGYRTNENNYYGQARMTRLTGKNASRNTILTGGLSIAKSLAYSSYLDRNRSASSYEDYRAAAEV